MESSVSSLRNRANGHHIFEENEQDLYVLTEQWKSDLLFSKDDLNFLIYLIDKYFIWISKTEEADRVRNIEASIVKTGKQCSNLLKRVDQHLSHLAKLIDNPYKYNSQNFRNEHQQLEDDTTKFVKKFRANRKEVIAITDHVIDNNEFIR